MSDIFKELYRYRALLSALVVRYLVMRYRGSMLGFLWSFLNPLCLMLVYFLVFKFYIRFEQVDNYTVFLFVGLLPWLWSLSGLLEGTASIVSGGHLITKSMFPAHILPAVAVLTTMVNFILSLPLLFLFMYFTGVQFHLTLLLLPLLLLLQMLLLHGLTLGLGAINVHFRDVQHVLGNLLTLVFFLCPILYPISSVPEKLRFTLTSNPFALLTICYHDLILEGTIPSTVTLLSLVGFVLLAILFGSVVYNRYRESFAELL